MGYRTMEITGPAEVHIKRGQICVEKGEEMISVPLLRREDENERTN